MQVKPAARCAANGCEVACFGAALRPDEAAQVKPAARWAHCALWDGADRLFVFGGQTNSHHLGDLHYFNLKEQRWHQPACMGAPPSPRQGARAALLAANLMLVFGGCSETVRPPPPPPSPYAGPFMPSPFSAG
jgi:hypothetical protein